MSDAKTILLVDDESNVRSSIKLMLRKGGYAFIEASDFDEAKEILAEKADTIALALTDFNYPGIRDNTGGADLVELLNREHPEIPVVVMSGESEQFEALARQRGLQTDGLFFKLKILDKTPTRETFIDLIASLTAGSQRSLMARRAAEHDARL